jgi:ribosomal protein L11 methyltransferase
MYYTRLIVNCSSESTEILMAELAEIGFESFIETDNGFEAYVEGDNFEQQQLTEVREKYQHLKPFEIKTDKVKKENWNEIWENSFDPIIVDDKIYIRAHFHPQRDFPYVITITPKMSFGTGHHETTYLMLKNQLKINHKNKTVMDAGCGTAILSIMASKLGARFIDAFDIDDWSTINGNENTSNNLVDNVQIRQGKITTLSFEQHFDIILANINKNILLDEMQYYAQHLTAGGNLLLSGFYEKDIPDLEGKANLYGLNKLFQDVRNDWAAMCLEKS